MKKFLNRNTSISSEELASENSDTSDYLTSSHIPDSPKQELTQHGFEIIGDNVPNLMPIYFDGLLAMKPGQHFYVTGRENEVHAILLDNSHRDFRLWPILICDTEVPITTTTLSGLLNTISIRQMYVNDEAIEELAVETSMQMIGRIFEHCSPITLAVYCMTGCLYLPKELDSYDTSDDSNNSQASHSNTSSPDLKNRDIIITSIPTPIPRSIGTCLIRRKKQSPCNPDYEYDHVIELQILTSIYSYSSGNIPLYLALEDFAKIAVYFNGKWNMECIKIEVNRAKGKYISYVLREYFQENRIVTVAEYCDAKGKQNEAKSLNEALATLEKKIDLITGVGELNSTTFVSDLQLFIDQLLLR